MSDIFLLTKPPRSERAKLCSKLLSRSKDARLYLCGDGVYCLLDSIDSIGIGLENCLVNNLKDNLGDRCSSDRVIVCREDAEARGITCVKGMLIGDDFYEKLIEDMMEERGRFYSF